MANTNTSSPVSLSACVPGLCHISTRWWLLQWGLTVGASPLGPGPILGLCGSVCPLRWRFLVGFPWGVTRCLLTPWHKGLHPLLWVCQVLAASWLAATDSFPGAARWRNQLQTASAGSKQPISTPLRFTSPCDSPSLPHFTFFWTRKGRNMTCWVLAKWMNCSGQLMPIALWELPFSVFCFLFLSALTDSVQDPEGKQDPNKGIW